MPIYNPAFLDPLIIPLANASTEEDTFKFYKQQVLFLTVSECNRECRVYINDSKSKLAYHITPGFTGIIQFSEPTNYLVLDWGFDTTIHTDTIGTFALYGYVSQEPPYWFNNPGSSMDTLFTRGFFGLGPLEPSFTVNFPYSAQFVAALAFMRDNGHPDTESDAIQTISLNNATDDQIEREKVLAVTPYLPIAVGSSASVPWDGSISRKSRASYVSVTQITTTAFAAATTQILTIHHSAAALKTARIWGMDVMIADSTVASNLVLALNYTDLATPPSGGTALSETPYDPANTGSAECAAIQLPAVAASTPSVPRARITYRVGVTGAAPVTNPAPVVPWVPLLHDLIGQPDSSGLVLRPTIAEGYLIQITPSVATTLNWAARVFWSEE